MDGFRAHLLHARSKEIDLIESCITAGSMTRDQIADMIIRSVNKVKNGADVEDSPIYAVCKWIKNNPITGLKNRNQLAKAIAADTGIHPDTAANVIHTRPLVLPKHLKEPRPYKSKKSGFEEAGLLINKVKKEEPAIKPKEGLVIPPNVDSLTIRSTGFELTINFRPKESVCVTPSQL